MLCIKFRDDKIDHLALLTVSDEKVSKGLQLFRCALDRTTARNHQATWMTTANAPEPLPRLTVSLGGNRTGVDEIRVGIDAGVHHHTSPCLKCRSHLLLFGLVQFAAKRMDGYAKTICIAHFGRL